jgi:type IV secretory pathway VirB10-like protein
MATPESGDTPPKGDPAAFALRAQPRAVTRLSRRTLVIATALMTALLFGGLWWALSMHPLRLTNGQELYSTGPKPTDALSALPGGGYAELTKPKPSAPPPSVPRLGPPLPGDLGRPILQQQAAFGTAAGADSAAQPRERERQQAAASAVFFTISARPTEASMQAPAIPGMEVAEPASGPAGEVGSGAGQSPQDRNQAFLDSRVDTAIYSPQQVQMPRSPYELLAGTVIAAAMVTGLNSDLPGQVVAQVTEDVYDSVTGQVLLVPQGSRLIGKHDSIVAYGQSRVLMIWTRLVMPDGSSIVLDNLPTTDTEGYAGLEDGVDYHTWRLLRGIALSTLLGISSELATNGDEQTSGTGNIIVALRQSGDSSANQAGQNIVSKDLSVQPTLTIRPGFPVRIIVNRDIILRPYQR